jgi:hypothetical protein
MEEVRALSADQLRRVAACAAGVSPAHSVTAEITRHRARGERTVLEFRFDDGLRIFAKRHPRRRDAVASYDILRSLWNRGFGRSAHDRVPEPLGCFPDWGVHLMRAAPGECLVERVTRPGPWEGDLRAAAAWLARLHASSLHLGPDEHLAQSVFRLARRVARATARRPELENLLVELIEELDARARTTGHAGSRVQTHGRYHPGHVFISPDGVTAIDLDRAALADPAKDVGEFLHRLCATKMRARFGGATSERAASAFTQEYASRAGALPRGLPFWWSYSILSSLVRVIDLQRKGWDDHLAFYLREFRAIPLRSLDPVAI